MFNVENIAGALGLFFLTLAVYKWLSRSASKRASAAKSLEQSKTGQGPTVSLHNPYPNGAPIPEAPQPSDPKPEQPPAPAPTPASAPAPVQQPTPAQTPAPTPAAPYSTVTASKHAQGTPVAPAAPASPEQIYKWN